MTLILFGLFIWGICAMLEAAAKKSDEERERIYAYQAELVQAENRRQWVNSLKGTTDDGQSRFGIVLDDNLYRQDWDAVLDMVDTLPDWPIRDLIGSAVLQAAAFRENIRLAWAAGVHQRICEEFWAAQLCQETALWRILHRTALVAQMEGMAVGWRRLPRSIRKGIQEDSCELGLVLRRLEATSRNLGEAMVTPDRTVERRAGRPLDVANRSTEHLIQVWNRPVA